MKFLSICLVIIISGYFITSSTIGNDKLTILKSLLSENQKEIIKQYLFPYKFILSQQEKEQELTKELDELKMKYKEVTKYEDNFDRNLYFKYLKKNGVNSLELELNALKELNSIPVKKTNVIKLSNNKELHKFKIYSGFYRGMHYDFPGSGYIDFYKDKIVLLSAQGILAINESLELEEETPFNQISTNINEFISFDQYVKSKDFSLKDLLIFKENILISFTEEINENCWNTSVLIGKMNLKYIEFKKLFSPTTCVHETDNLDSEFNATQSGGRMIDFENDSILLSIGDYRSRFLAQDINSVNGKILEIDINSGLHKLISMGHRNPQGLLFDRANNIILSTEHGPNGGGEVNIIDIEKINEKNPLNYGWPISSYGKHYGSDELNKNKYEKYPLYKSHSKYGFIEPLLSFSYSIAISEIVSLNENKYVFSSMGGDRKGGKTLYFFEINQEKKISKLEEVRINERIRDLKFKNGILLLFLEDSASIGKIYLNSFPKL